MKKKFRFALVVCAAMAALCSCTNDELVDQSGNGTGNGALRFNMQVKNRTRAGSSTALQDTHYEFGVSGFAESVSSDNAYMQNYLVAYATPDNNKYKSWANTNVATTWGDGLDLLNGSSYWVYERLGNKDITDRPTKSVHEHQYLRFWDETTEKSHFFAYAPYRSVTETLEDDIHKVTLNNVSSFYTSPVTQMDGAVTKGKMDDTYGKYNSELDLTTDLDIINANEVIYAATTVEKANYGNDVPFEFKHANAKILLAFYTDITSYDVTLTDLVPEEISGSPFTIAKQEGIVLTPADATNKDETTQPTPNKKFVKGYEALTITNGATLGWGTPTKSTENLLFKVPTETVSTTPSTLTYLPTVYYAVPAPTNNTCGFTVHVSYKLKSKATGTDDQIQLYDARVWVPAANCQWEAGKAYTYIFKITDKSSGTTNPQREDPATAGQPYIDPSDPRVIETGELHPIEFTAMVQTGFDEIYDGLFNVSIDLKTKPISAGFDNILYTEYATYGVKPYVGYTIISPKNGNMFNYANIQYDNVKHIFKLPFKNASSEIEMFIPLAALSYTDIKTDNTKKNTAFTYVYTDSEGTSAIKITATEESVDTWQIATENVHIGSQIYAHAIYIKNLDSKSYDATVGTEINQVYEFDGKTTYELTSEKLSEAGISLASSSEGEGASLKRKITISGTPTTAGIYTFTFTEANLGRKFVVTVTVDNKVETKDGKASDDTYKYTTAFNYKIPSLSGYNIISPSNMANELSPKMSWQYNTESKEFTFTNETYSMTFANLGTVENPYVAFWIDANTLEVITGTSCEVSQSPKTGTSQAYTIFKKQPTTP